MTGIAYRWLAPALLLAVPTAGGVSASAAQDAGKPGMQATDGGIIVSSGTILRTAEQTPNVSAAPALPGTFEDHAFILRGSLWRTTIIPVCWERLAGSTAADRGLVRTSVARSWAANSKLRFVGWRQCPSAFNGIRIAVEDSGPHTKGLGRYISGVRNGMVLNFTFRNWSQDCQPQRQSCITSIAVHEFGHAIGFAHEQNRPDTPGECRKPVQGPNGDLMLTSWDPESAMNYCNEKYNNDGVLSELDRYALTKVYG